MTTVALPTPARPKGRIPERTVLLVASFGAFLAFLDATIVNVAFPSIQHSFPTSSISSLSWILNAYSITFAAFLVVSGRLADLLGRRWAFTTGVIVFTVASAFCAAAGSVGFLVVARIVQALGAAILVPASLALVVQAFPAVRRSHAVGLWGASAALAAGLGPPIGGALVEFGGWRWAFLVNIPIGLAALWAGRNLLVESRAPGRRRTPDLRGATLSALTLGLLTLGLVKGQDWGWTSPAIIGCFVGAALMLVGFVLSSRASRTPLIDPALLRIRSFAVGNVATIVGGAGFYAYLLCNILWLQYVWHYSVLVSGLAVVPGAIVAAVLAAVLGPVAQKRGYRLVIVPGAIIWALAYVWYVVEVPVTPNFLTGWLPGQILSSIGVGMTLPVLGSAALAAVPGGRFATASAVNSSARQIGAVLGIAILVIIVGNPTTARPASVVDSLRNGWVFSAIAFALTAVIALFLGRVRSAASSDDDLDDGAPPLVTLPAPRDVVDPGASTLAAAPLLSRLPIDARTRLEDGAVPVDLVAGEFIFHEGDEADDLYVVKAGRLDVVTGGQVVRQLGAGAVIGELALLTGGARSASIRARRDSHLLRISHDTFTAAVGNDPIALTALAGLLAEQLQTGAPGATQAATVPQPRVVAVVALHTGAPAGEVAAALKVELARTLRVGTPGKVGPDGLERAEGDYDRVLLVAIDPEADPDWWTMCVRQADHLVLVARAGEAVALDAPLGRKDSDLVLVGAATSEHVRAWEAALRPWKITRTNDNELQSDLRAVGSRIAGRSVGVVMAGGGARAFAHIGVLHELTEAGVAVDRVAGASVGSIIAALWASGRTPQQVEDIVYAEMVRGRPFSDYTLPVASVAKGKRVEKALRRHFGDVTIEELPRRLVCMSTDLQARQPYALRRGPVVDAVLASVALPVLFPPRRAGQRLLADGGVLDNLPVGVLTDRDEGPVLAVNIGMGGGGSPRTSDGPGAAAAPRPARIPALGETLMRTIFIGSGGATETARAAGAIVVTPSTMGVGLLEFHQIDRMIESGRAAARAVLAEPDNGLI